MNSKIVCIYDCGHRNQIVSTNFVDLSKGDLLWWYHVHRSVVFVVVTFIHVCGLETSIKMVDGISSIIAALGVLAITSTNMWSLQRTTHCIQTYALRITKIRWIFIGLICNPIYFICFTNYQNTMMIYLSLFKPIYFLPISLFQFLEQNILAHLLLLLRDITSYLSKSIWKISANISCSHCMISSNE